MTTCLDIITRGYRMIGVVGRGEVATGSDAEDGMARLQSLILNLPGFLKNAAPWCDKTVATSYTAKIGQRITVPEDVVITLPRSISYGGNATLPLDLAKVQQIGGDTPGLWLFSATNASWKRADALTLNSDSPFGEEDTDGLAALFALNVADEYGEEIPARTAGLASQATASFRSRFKKCNAFYGCYDDYGFCQPAYCAEDY